MATILHLHRGLSYRAYKTRVRRLISKIGYLWKKFFGFENQQYLQDADNVDVPVKVFAARSAAPAR
jgi:hypothetical protein